MNRTWIQRATWVALLTLLVTCQTNDRTGRSQFLLYSDAEMVQLGEAAYLEMTVQDKTVHIVTDPRLVDPLLRVGKSIAAAADKPEYKWEFKLIDAPKVANAWALPGGKIAFYTGIYPIVKDEAGMAVVMGHEVMHAILEHSNERMSSQVAVGVAMAGVAVGVGLSDTKYKGAIIGALGAGTGVGMLAFSRKHETEADQYGLYLCARAGYDPQAGIAVWERMAAMSEGNRPPEILSTHPDPVNRIANMREWMPKALELYNKSDKKVNRDLPAIR
jgi:predicted Zn-dependent protease